MKTTRRWYIYLVSAISLQAVAWAIIALLRNLLISGFDPQTGALAFQIAVIIIGLPIFIGHWLWAGRLAAASVEEQTAVLRRLYLYGMMAAFLAPFAANGYDLIGSILRSPTTLARDSFIGSTGEAVIYHLTALIVLALLWFYHQRILTAESRLTPLTDSQATVRRLYLLGFSAAGLLMTTLATIQVIHWLLRQLDPDPILMADGLLDGSLAPEIARLLVGIPLWLIFWYRAQTLFERADNYERESVLRQLYLYVVVFLSALGSVTSMTAILAGLLRSWLGLPPEGDIRGPLSFIIGLALVWTYHALVLRDDARLIREEPRQAEVRRLYLYLVAGIGLAALLLGVSGDISVVLRSFDDGFGDSLREATAWFTAAILAGLPVWLLPWRQVQLQATRSDLAGQQARQSLVRKIYIYFFLFVAVVTVLFSAIYVVAGLLNWILSVEPLTLTELGQAIAFSLIAVGVWLYHMLLLRSDNRLADQEQLEALTALRLAVVEVDEQGLGQALVAALKTEFPGLVLEPIRLARSTSPPPESPLPTSQTMLDQLAQAKVIVGPWEMIVPTSAAGPVSPSVAQAIMTSPARKLLMPTQSTAFDWIGVENIETEKLIKQTVRAIKQLAAGDSVRSARPLGVGATIATVVGVFLFLLLLVIPILIFFA